jgi:hypothetical protein
VVLLRVRWTTALRYKRSLNVQSFWWANDDLK